MVKRVFILAALIITLLAGVSKCNAYAGLAIIIIGETTHQYITELAPQYSEVKTGDTVYLKGKAIFNKDGIWRNFYAVLDSKENILLRLEINEALVYLK